MLPAEQIKQIDAEHREAASDCVGDCSLYADTRNYIVCAVCGRGYKLVK